MQTLDKFFSDYRAAWRANSAEQIESFWATDEPGPFYKAEEIDEIMTDWDALRAYWRHNEGFNETNELSYSDFKSQSVGDDRLLVGMRMRWDIKFADDARLMDGSAFSWAGQKMGGDNHVIALLREAAEELKLTAWVEAPNAPILYMADLYMKNTR